ncbi:MAG: CRISPR-associated protein Cas4, partial [Muribaculaceae bacterium]|nr:CRISPR-associated protein Cas4 [Muribaculaceae bacterium]
TDEADGYLQELEEAFNKAGEAAEAWFRPENKIFAERAIYLPATGETFRPDRVVVTPDGRVTVVDYKFTTEAREGHRRQVELYISLLRRMGREKVEGFLWYPLLGLIIKV